MLIPWCVSLPSERLSCAPLLSLVGAVGLFFRSSFKPPELSSGPGERGRPASLCASGRRPCPLPPPPRSAAMTIGLRLATLALLLAVILFLRYSYRLAESARLTLRHESFSRTALGDSASTTEPTPALKPPPPSGVPQTLCFRKASPKPLISEEMALRCLQLQREVLGMQSLKKVNSTLLCGQVTQLMRCPWTLNLTQLEQQRTELRLSCNATGQLVVTQDNTPLGGTITYDAEKRTRQVDTEIFNMLPQSPPWAGAPGARLGRCAVVGNGGILRNSSCGAHIDRADFVIRFNLPPLNYSRDVGVKSSLVTVNPTQIIKSYRNLNYARRPFVQRVSTYENAHLVLPAFAFSFCTDPCFRVYYTLQDNRPHQRALFYHPDYLRQLATYWREKGLRETRLSTGLMMVSAALELCDHVELYGFWPFSFDLSERPLSNHYYDDVPPNRGMHAMPEEFLRLLRMHSQGVLQLRVGQCP
ncbi:SIA8F sialyltransferase, partial [Atractosteus spatula]|nr:SIA8F sialyltransferase [Atractosteus spatula]